MTDKAPQSLINKQHSERFGQRSLTLLVVASMIGSGVFTTSGFTLGAVGSPLRVMICWLIAGGIALCGAVTYGQLARLMPTSGGEYLYLSRSVHPLAGFLAGWVSLTAGFSGAIAFAAVAFEEYAFPDGTRPDWIPPDSVSILLIVFCAMAHAVKPDWGKWFQNVIVVIKATALVCFLTFVVYRFPTHRWNIQGLSTASAPGVPLLTSIATSLVWISLSYAGFNAAIYVASESKTASESVPKALWGGTLLVTVLYLVLNAIFVTAVPAEELAWQEPVAAIAAKAIGGTLLELLIRVAVCLGLLTSVSGMIMTGPRVYSKMADDGVFPAALSASQNGISRSIVLQAMISIGLIVAQRGLVNAELLTSSLLGLLIYLSTTLSISSACCALTLFLPSVRRKQQDGSLVQDLAAVVYAGFTLLAVLIMVISHQEDGQSRFWHHAGGVLLTVASGVVVWRVWPAGAVKR